MRSVIGDNWTSRVPGTCPLELMLGSSRLSSDGELSCLATVSVQDGWKSDLSVGKFFLCANPSRIKTATAYLICSRSNCSTEDNWEECTYYIILLALLLAI